MAIFNFTPPAPIDRVHVVDYQTCDICGFRLMRIESTSKQSAPTVIHCAICGMHQDEKGITLGKNLTADERINAFDHWLAGHGLTRMMLEETYRLRIESFFDFDE